MVALWWGEVITIEEARCSSQARQDVVTLLVETVEHRRCGMASRMQQQRLVTPLTLTSQEIRLTPLGAMRQGIRQNGTDMVDVHMRAPTPPGESLGIAIHGTRQAVGGAIAYLVA